LTRLLLSVIVSCPLLISLFVSFFSRSCYHLDLHSFPTRRSSDLSSKEPGARTTVGSAMPASAAPRSAPASRPSMTCWCQVAATRSEEHTSELQSRFDLVCRLLLEKKK